MELGEYLDGMITRDGEDHFTFVENATEQRKAERRNPSIYMGQWINVKRRADGTVYPTFKRTKGIGAGTLGDYAVNTTCELLMVAGKHEAAMALAEVEGFDLSELFATDRGLGEEEDFEQEYPSGGWRADGSPCDGPSSSVCQGPWSHYAKTWASQRFNVSAFQCKKRHPHFLFPSIYIYITN